LSAYVEVGKGNTTTFTDVAIAGHPFEIKTVSLGANRTFQFNHVRMDRNYEYLLCLGICRRRSFTTCGVRGKSQNKKREGWCAWRKVKP